MGGNGNDNRTNFNSPWANSLHSVNQLILESNVIDKCQERRLMIGGFHQMVWYPKSRDFVTGLLCLLSRVRPHKKNCYRQRLLSVAVQFLCLFGSK